MTFELAFNDLKPDAPRQRVRCSATGRFVAWSKVPQLRAPGARRSVFVCPPVVLNNTDAPPVVSVLSRMRESLDLAVGVVAVAAVFTVSATVSAVAGAVSAVAGAVSSIMARAGDWIRGSKGGSM